MRAPRPILFCATGVRDTVGGIASANRNVLAALRSLGAETGRPVVTLAFGEAGSDSADYRRFAGDKVGFSLAAMVGAVRSDLVVIDHVRLSLPVFYAPKAIRPPVAILAHGSEATWNVRRASRRAFAKATVVLANSRYTHDRMRQFVPRFKGQPCPLGLPPQFAMTDAPPEPSPAQIVLEAADGRRRMLGRRVLLLVGRMDASELGKGHRELIAAMPSVLADCPEAQMVFVGDGTALPDLVAAARSSPAAGAIFLPGRLAEAELQALYAKSFAYVMPSRQEGFGLVYLEAMNYAKPCLACLDDGGADVVIDGETGVLIPREFDENQLRQGLKRLLDAPERAREWGEAGWRRMRDHFSSAAHQARVVAALKPLLEMRR